MKTIKANITNAPAPTNNKTNRRSAGITPAIILTTIAFKVVRILVPENNFCFAIFVYIINNNLLIKVINIFEYKIEIKIKN